MITKSSFLIFIIILSGVLLGKMSEPVLRTHAHNDYLHDRPLYDALTQGFISVEADVLLRDNELYIGHNKIDLENKPLVTLESLYLQPLFNRYQQLDGFIYPAYSDLFYLWIDIKYDGEAVIGVLKEVIRPYLSMLYSRKKNPGGKVQLIISGDRPYNMISADPDQFFYIDGRPVDLASNYSSEIMPFVSQNIQQVCQVNAGGYLDDKNFDLLQTLVNKCHAQQKSIRLWATPDNDKMWSQLLEAKVDLINTDDLHGLVSFLKN